MQVIDIEFEFKGSRSYIHGTDMFNVLLENACCNHVPTDIRFVIHDFVRTPGCHLYSVESREELNSLQDIRVHCQYGGKGDLHWLALKEGASSQGGGRREYKEENIIALCRLTCEGIVMDGMSPFSFIENVVAMTKHLHQHLYCGLTGKWIFSRIDLEGVVDTREGLSVNLRHNMNHRLTKSDILVNGIKAGDLYFSLVNE